MTRRVACPIPAQIFMTVVYVLCRGSTGSNGVSTEAIQGSDGCREMVATAHQQVETTRHLIFSQAASAGVSAGACDRVYAFEMRLTVSSRVLYPFCCVHVRGS